jgi:16S rRNA (cytidine1402-2'-O)-methyltransferase
MGTLYLIATPIGNLEDMTLRALRLLRAVRLVAAEDTRHTRRLLTHYEIATPLISYHEHNKLQRVAAILAALAEGDVALVSDAGTPAVNDPGYELVVAAIDAGFPVSPIPGASATLAALVASGLPTAHWTFLGFLPNRAGARRTFLEGAQHLHTTLICFETPHRLQAALADILAMLGNRRICVARELTKLHEEFVRGTVADALAYFEATAPRGEFVLVIEGATEELQRQPQDEDPWQERAQARLHALRAQGIPGSAAARQVSKELGVARGAVYRLWVSMSEEIEGTEGS